MQSQNNNSDPELTKENIHQTVLFTLYSIIYTGETNKYYVIANNIINDILEIDIDTDDKVSNEIDDNLKKLQSSINYGTIFRAFRKHFSYGIHTESEFIEIFNDLKTIVKNNDNINNSYLECIDESLDFVSEKIDEYNNNHIFTIENLILSHHEYLNNPVKYIYALEYISLYTDLLDEKI